jgi:hypothetical protein
MKAKYQLATLVLIYSLVQLLLYFVLKGKSGGDIAFQIFSIIFLIFYGIILWAVARPWKISRTNLLAGLFICTVIVFVISQVI